MPSSSTKTWHIWGIVDSEVGFFRGRTFFPLAQKCCPPRQHGSGGEGDGGMRLGVRAWRVVRRHGGPHSGGL